MYSKLSTSLLAEFIGTFALIFIGAGAGALGIGGLVGVALAHGFVVLGFAYAYGHISGTHINPAVTLGVWAAGKIETARAASYIVFQIARRHCRRARPALGPGRHRDRPGRHPARPRASRRTGDDQHHAARSAWSWRRS